MTPEQAKKLKDGDAVFVVLDSGHVEVTRFVDDEGDRQKSLRVKSDVFKTVPTERAFEDESFAWIYIYDKLKGKIDECKNRLKDVRENLARTSYTQFSLRRMMDGKCIQCGSPGRYGKLLCSTCAGGKGKVRAVRGVDWNQIDWTKTNKEIATEIGMKANTVQKNRKRLKT